MIRSRLALALALLLALVACTGTREESIPIILVVGSVETGGPQLQLFEDVRDPPPRDLVPLSTPLGLPAPPVSLDVVDRNGDRSELVVLDANGTLHFVDISDLPGSFAITGSLDVAALVPPDPSGPFCWQQVQVGGTSSDPGRYAALLESCADGLPEAYVVDLEAQEFLYALTEQHVGTQLLPVGIHVDQGSDRLYFPTDDITGIEVLWLPIAGASAPTLLGETQVDPLEAVDFAPLLNGLALLGVDGVLGLVPLEGDAPAPLDLDLTSALMLLPDPSGNGDLVAAFGNSRGAVAEGVEDADPERLFLEAPVVDATLEPVQRFAYLLEEGGIEILDLFPYAEPPTTRLLFIDLPGLADPRVITWAFGTRLP